MTELKIGAVRREGKYLLKHLKITPRNTLCSGSFILPISMAPICGKKKSEFLSWQKTDFCCFLVGSLVPVCPAESFKFVLKPI